MALQFYPARAALHKVLGHEDAHTLPSDSEHVLTTVGLFIPILICGVFIADLGLLYQLIGGFCSTFLAYIIPGLCYFFVFWSDKSQSYAYIATSGEDEDDDEHGQEGFDDNSDEEDSGNDTQSIGKKKAALEKHSSSQLERGQVSIQGDNDNEEQILLPFNNTTHHCHTHHTSSYGTTATATAALGSASSISSAESGTSGRRARRRLSTFGKRPRKTELWLDVGAGILLVFGVFVMIISTATTLKKMAGYA
ncbi:hypothetical protein BGZ82_005964 [Podila clonocystis]|nr:hypothetical protein BGZ82_005964 [Podila clonocystis]